jgi:hypothetical protein
MKVKQRGNRGQSLVEFALMLPVLLIILAGVLDLGRLYYAHVAVADAAAEGAAVAAISPNDSEEVFNRAQHASGGLVELERDRVQITCASCPNVRSGDPIAVTVSYEFGLGTPFLNAMLPGGVLNLTATVEEAVLVGGI